MAKEDNTIGIDDTCDIRELINRISGNVERRVCDMIKDRPELSQETYNLIVRLVLNTLKNDRECLRTSFTQATVEQIISQLIFLTLLNYFRIKHDDMVVTFVKGMEIGKISSSVEAIFQEWDIEASKANETFK